MKYAILKLEMESQIRNCRLRCAYAASTVAVGRCPSGADMFALRIRTRAHLIRFAVKLFGETFIAQAAGKVIQIV